MTEKLEKWQEALTNYCAGWRKGVSASRKSILKKYGDLNKLVIKGRPVLKRESSASEVKIRIRSNKHTDALHYINDEARETGNEFVTNIIGLRPKTLLHQIFVDYWISSVIPELGLEFDIQHFVAGLTEGQPIEQKSVIEIQQGKKVIRDSISWIRGEVSLQDLAYELPYSNWPSYGEIEEEGALPP